MKKLLIMTVALFTLAVPIAGRADTGNIKQFVGLWEAVDPEDGSHQILSITNSEDGNVKLHLSDTYFTLCDGGRAIGEGTAQFIKKRSLHSDDFTVTCFESATTQKTPTTVTKNPDGTLTRDRDTLAPLTYHQTSK